MSCGFVRLFPPGRSLLLVFLAVQGGVVANPGTAMGIASAKTSLTFAQAFARGILCNWLVCMAGRVSRILFFCAWLVGFRVSPRSVTSGPWMSSLADHGFFDQREMSLKNIYQ